MRRGFQIALVIPARNEAAALPGVLLRVPSWVDDVVVVDNGSTDRTAEVARSCGAQVVYEDRPGYGAACARGVSFCVSQRARIIAFLDADGSDDPRELPKLLDPLLDGEARLVVGCRPKELLPRHQRLGTQFVCRLLSRGFGVEVADLGPFRAIWADTLDMRDRAIGWTAEMQARALRFGVPIREVEVSWRPGLGRSEITGTWTGVLRAGRDLLRRSLSQIAGAWADCLRAQFETDSSTRETGHRPPGHWR